MCRATIVVFSHNYTVSGGIHGLLPLFQRAKKGLLPLFQRAEGITRVYITTVPEGKTRVIGASLSEPHNCWCLLPVRVYVCTYVAPGGVRCLRASAASDVGERVQYRLRTIERPCAKAKGLARHGSGEAIITKKRFVPEKFFTMCMEL